MYGGLIEITNPLSKYAEEIYTDIERYRSLVDVLISYEEGDYLETKMQEFNDYLDLFL